MPRNLSTRAFFIRRVVLLTAFSVAASVGITLLALRIISGGDPSFTVTAAQLEWFALTLSSLTPAIVCPIACFRSAKITAEIEKARHDLDILARTDQLTGLLNRRGFDAAAHVALDADRTAKRPTAVLLCDIDHFKRINDLFGHDIGDQALIHVADTLRSFSTNRLIVAGRQGGDEFAMLLSGVALKEAVEIGEAIRAACAAIELDENASGFSVSIGAAVSTRADVPLPALMRRADVALYEAKHGGRNRVLVADLDQLWTDAA
jgi:diguanylate cyclase (GGDEF)-like protein